MTNNVLLNKILIFILGFGFVVGVLTGCNTHDPSSSTDQQVLVILSKASGVAAGDPQQAMNLVKPITNKGTVAKISDSTAWRLLQVFAETGMALGHKDSTVGTILNIRDFSNQTDRQPLKTNINLWLAQQYIDDGKYFLAGKFLDESLEYLDTTTDEYSRARAFNLYGSLMGYKGNYGKAQEYLIKAASGFEKLGNRESLSGVYINIGNNYADIGDNRQALKFLRKARQSSLAYSDTINYMNALCSIGRLMQVEQSDSAEFYYKKTLEFKTKPWLVEKLSAKFQLANLYVDRREFDKAYDLYTEIKDTCSKYHIESGIYRAITGLGNIFEGRGQDAMAIEQFIQAYDMAHKAGETRMELQLMEAIRYMHVKAHQYSSAHDMLLRIKNLGDSLLTLDKQLIVHDLELMYNNQAASLDNQKLQAHLDGANTQSKVLKIFVGISLVFIAVLVGLLYFVFRLYWQRNQAYKTLFDNFVNTELKVTQLMADIETFRQVPANDDDESTLLYEKIVHYFETQKPYLNSQLKIDDVALGMSMSRKNLSALILKHSNMHFVAFVNTYRVKEVLKLLDDAGYKHYKVEALAKEAGFGSKVSFYAAFAQVTGYKPSDYKNK